MKHLVLVGLMATGKSTAGRLIAEVLGRALVDTDHEVESRAGRSVRDIWRSHGEGEFRRLETETLADVLARPTPSVVAAAGGVVLAEPNRDLLARDDVVVVWLRARPETLARRVREAGEVHRPLLDDDPAGMLERMDHDRARLYEAVADHVVDVDDRSPDEVAAAVEAVVGEGS